MERLGHIYFDAEDRPPQSYWHKKFLEADNLSIDDKKFNSSLIKSSKIDPKEWAKAPEFIPKSRRILQESFNGAEFRMQSNWRSDNGTVVEVMQFPNFINRCTTIKHLRPINSQPSQPLCQLSTTVNMPQPIFTPHAPFQMRHEPHYLVPQALTSAYPAPNLHNNPPFFFNPGFRFPPAGYSMNFAQIPAGIGPPIPAVILKKKRRKRNRKNKRFSSEEIPYLICTRVDSDSASTRESTQIRLQTVSSEPALNKEGNKKNLTIIEQSTLGASCPELSDSQLQIWDNLLYDAVVKGDRTSGEGSGRTNNEPEYEIASRAVLDAMDSALCVDGISSKEVRKLDYQLQGRKMDESLSEDHLVKKLQHFEDNRFIDSPASTTRSLKAEIEELTFRPTISQYGYPEMNSPQIHMATFNPDYNTFSSNVIHQDIRCEEDCFEGMNIRVNAFDTGDELALSDSELPQPSHFQQILWMLQKNKQYYTQLSVPEKVCCNIM